MSLLPLSRLRGTMTSRRWGVATRREVRQVRGGWDGRRSGAGGCAVALAAHRSRVGLYTVETARSASRRTVGVVHSRARHKLASCEALIKNKPRTLPAAHAPRKCDKRQIPTSAQKNKHAPAPAERYDVP